MGVLAVLVWSLAGCGAEPTVTPEASSTPRPTAIIRPLITIVATGAPTLANSPTFTPRLPPTSTPTREAYPPPPATPTAVPTSTPTPVTPTNTPTESPTARPVPSITPTRAHPVYGGPPLDNTEVGIQVHLHQEDVSLIIRHLQVLRVGWVKVQVSWKLFEPEKGRYDTVFFGELDDLVSQAAANQIFVMLGVAKAPDWSRPTTELDGPPREVADFEDFMRYLADRYRGNVAAYELWNEANLRREWNGFPLSAADFVELVRAGAASVRAADPLAIVISGAPATTGINDGVDAIDDRVYLREMLAAGVADAVDAIGAHPYGWANPPDASASAPDPAAPTHNNHPSFYFRDTLWDYFTILNQAGRSEKQIWVTEFGWGSFDRMKAPPPEGFEYMRAVDEWQQATYTLRAFELAHQWRWVGPLFLWNLNFAPLLGTEFSESGYSLLRPDGSPRPVYLALETMLD